MQEENGARGGAVTRLQERMLVLVLAGVLVALCAVRFDRRWSWGGIPGEAYADHLRYVRYVAYFRGESPEPPPPPFRQRAAGPWLASYLPFRPITSIDVLDVLALLLCLPLMASLLRCLGMGPPRRLAGLAMFTLSFPVVQYGAIGYLDPLILLVLAVVVWALVAGHDLLAIAVAAAGFLVKESVLVAWPAIAVARASSVSALRFWTLEAPGLLVLALGPGLAAGALGPEGGGPGVDYWQVSWSVLLANASRPRAWISGLLSAGLPLAGALLYGIRRARGGPRAFPPRDERILVAGTAMVLALWAFSFLGVYADGRFPWLAYPFAIPLALALADGSSKRLNRAGPAGPPA
jgi:hypothetical protein